MVINGQVITPTAGMLSNGRCLYSMTLPRSKYYAQAADWETVAVESASASNDCIQAAVNGQLWKIDATTIMARSLTTGEVTYSEANPLITTTGAPYVTQTGTGLPCCTDGEQRIWFMSVDNQTIYKSAKSTASGSTWKGYLNEWNVVTKQMTSYLLAETYCSGSSSSAAYGGLFLGGSLVYSAKNNRVYYFGGCFIKATSKNYIAPFYLDLTENAITSIGTNNILIGEGFGYEDPETGFIYFGGGFSVTVSTNAITFGTYNPALYYYDPSSNTYTTVRADFVTLGFGSGNSHAYITMGDRMLDMSATGVVSFDPTTGDTIEGQMPAAFGGTMTSGMKANYANVLYAWVSESGAAMKKCPFFTTPPDDAPIVCKIYEGQKYHTLVPFSIPRLGLDLTTVQQTAEQDYEIKMYDYSSEGGQIIYIETA